MPAPPPGSIPLTGTITPTDTLDTYAVFDTVYGKGGYRSMASVVDMQAIPLAHKVAGMLVYVIGTDTIYKLGTDLNTWSPLQLGASGSFLPLDGSQAMTGPLVLAGQPTAAQHAAPKSYVDSLFANGPFVSTKGGDTIVGDLLLGQETTQASGAVRKSYVDAQISQVSVGMRWRQPVLVVSAAADLSGLPVVDGIQLATGDRIIRNSTTNTAANGIYTVAAGAWVRASDADTADKLRQACAWVTSGQFAENIFVVSTDGAITLGSTPITWARLQPNITYVGADDITVSGNTIAAGPNLQRRGVNPVALTSGTLDFDLPRRTFTTVSGSPQNLAINAVANFVTGKDVFLRYVSTNTTDTWALAAAGITVQTQGVFVPGITNHIIVQAITSSVVLVLINPIM